MAEIEYVDVGDRVRAQLLARACREAGLRVEGDDWRATASARLAMEVPDIHYRHSSNGT
jgi:hypothetical protein